MKKHIILTTFILLFGIVGNAQTFNHSEVAPSGQTLYYNVLSNGTAQVVHPAQSSEFTWSSYTAPTDTLIIPDSITYGGTKYPVTSIGERAFYLFCQGLTSVILPNTIGTIENQAFSYCTGLESITLGTGITTIQNRSFEACSTLTSIILPNTTTSLGTQVFFGCTELTYVILSNSLTTIPSQTFSSCGELKSVIIPEGITNIGSSAFYNCHKLDSLTLPSTITLIGTYAFGACDSLELFMMSEIPPTLSSVVFDRTTVVHIPCGSLLSYQTTWGTYWFSYDDPLNEIDINILSNDTLKGMAFSVANIGCDTIIIEASSNYGYHFSQWSNGSVMNPDTIMLLGDTTITAIFDINHYYISGLSNNDSCGYVQGSDTSYYLDTITLIAVPTSGFHFIEWSDGSTDNPRQIIVTKDSSLVAVFGCQITTSSNNTEWGQVIGGGLYPYQSVQIIQAIPSDGYRFIRWENGDTNNRVTFSLSHDTSFYAIFAPILESPQLCMVSVENDHNVLIWNNPESFSYYRLYRESIVAGEYEAFADVTSNSPQQYVDTTSRPSTRSYRYKISGVDEYGIETPLSDEHKTMHLTINQGLGGRWNLQWTPYEGAEYTTYIIYKGDNTDNMQQIDIMPADGNTSYTDETATTGDVYYQVGIVMSTPCSSSDEIGLTKSSSVSLSNIATNSSVGIREISENGVDIYSKNGYIYIDSCNECDIRVYDIYGRIIVSSYRNIISAPTSGIYLVKVGNHPAKKIVVIK